MRQIGKELNIGLAPMEGVTDYPLRVWLHLISRPDFLCTPFLRATETYPHKEWPKDFCPELTGNLSAHYKTIPQIMAKNAKDFINAYTLAAEHIDTIDINCGEYYFLTRLSI